MSTSVLGPPQPVQRATEAALSACGTSNREFTLPSLLLGLPTSLRHAAGSMQGSCGSVQKQSPRVLQVSSGSQRQRKHTKARRKPVQNPELLKKKGIARLLVKHLKEGAARLLVKHLKDSSGLPKSSGPDPCSHPLDVPLQLSKGFGFFLPRVLSHLPSGMNDSRSKPEAS